MKILLTGANGQLGQAIIKNKPKLIENNIIELIALKKHEFNLLDYNNCKSLIQNIKPDWVINAAAYTLVDEAEKNPLLAFQVNEKGPKAIAEALFLFGGKLLQISTDFVFDGKKGKPYEPTDLRNPLSIYGKSKAKGEEIVEEILIPKAQAKIIRTSWLMGPSGKNFALTILNLHRKTDEIKVVADQVGSPTTTDSLSIACWQMIKKDIQGVNLPNILHWSDLGVASWYDVAIAIGELGEKVGLIDTPANVIPISSKEYGLLTPRPNYSVLDSSITRQLIDLKAIHWRYTLERLLILHSQL